MTSAASDQLVRLALVTKPSTAVSELCTVVIHWQVRKGLDRRLVLENILGVFMCSPSLIQVFLRHFFLELVVD
jgi:hypothetical protein